MIFDVIVSYVAYLFMLFLLYLVYNYWKNYTFWFNSGLPYIPFPRDSVIYPAHKAETFKRFYEEMAPHPVAGFHKMSRPHLLIRDPKIIRKVLIKDFSYFNSHGVKIFEDLDPLTLHLFNLKDERWKNVRQKMTPMFTGGKLKMMFPSMLQCKDAFEKYLDGLIQTHHQINLMEVTTKFAMDVFSICGFGLKSDALQDEDSELMRIMKLVFVDSNYFALRSFLRSTNLPLVKLFGVKRVPEVVDNFFFSLIRETAKLRKENAEERNDIIQHLINCHQEEKEKLKNQNGQTEPVMTEAIVAAQAFFLFLAGYEPTSATMAYCLYELALQPQILHKCRKEVRSVLAKHGGDICYEFSRDLPYLESVIDETLRKYAVLGWLDRTCNKDYELPELSYTIKKGTRLIIPVHALHYDPKYYPDPYKFDPDRFSEENKRNIVPGTYLPFGEGPRRCLGIRFAQIVTKTALACLINKYDFEPSEKTEIPLRFVRTLKLSMPQRGIWLRMKKAQEV